MAFHYRDSQAGKFYLDRDSVRYGPREVMPFMRFTAARGFARDLWAPLEVSADQALREAGLDWWVDLRTLSIPAGSAPGQSMEVHGYRALVRPDTDQVMSVEKTSYSIAENRWVAEAAETLGRRLDPSASLIGAASFGRHNERTLFVVRLTGNNSEALCLLVYNTQGGAGAVRFRLVHADRAAGAVLAPESAFVDQSVFHSGNVQRNLDRLARYSNFITDHLTEVEPLLGRLRDRSWSPRHTRALIKELWGEAPDLRPTTPDGTPLTPPEEALRHPGKHLEAALDGHDDPWNAYRCICTYLENESEACERGDFTKDRDERLALGAGLKFKQRAWRWIIANTT